MASSSHAAFHMEALRRQRVIDRAAAVQRQREKVPYLHMNHAIVEVIDFLLYRNCNKEMPQHKQRRMFRALGLQLGALRADSNNSSGCKRLQRRAPALSMEN